LETYFVYGSLFPETGFTYGTSNPESPKIIKNNSGISKKLGVEKINVGVQEEISIRKSK